jgi:hypothetical protein
MYKVGDSIVYAGTGDEEDVLMIGIINAIIDEKVYTLDGDEVEDWQIVESEVDR